MVIGIDFDGTCVTHEYPKVGKDIGAIPVLKELLANGHRLVLNTMRSDKSLHEAVQWFYGHGIKLYGINKNPIQHEWTRSPKVYANLYIDDAGLGIPLIYPIDETRPYVDWIKVRQLLIEQEIIK
jgi:hypothetical protein